MTPFLIDTHCHLHFPAYDAQSRDAALLRMKEKNIWAITVGTTARTSAEAIAFAESHDGVFATVGHHPEHLTSTFHDESEGSVDAFDIDEIERLASSSKKVIGIGETGLDFYRIDPTWDVDKAKQLQEDVFRQHISIALKLDLPIVIHSRDAFDRLLQVLKAATSYEPRATSKPLRGVLHCFTGTWQEAKPLLDLGLHIAFGGIITFPSKKTLDPETSVLRAIERIPLDRILVETDAPWLAPVPFRGKQNEPSYVEFVAQKIAEVKGVACGEIARITTENARHLFRI